MQNPAVLHLDRFANLFHKAVSQYRLSLSHFCCLYCGEQKLSATSVGGALCLSIKLSDSDVMTPRNLSVGTKKMLWTAKRWPWVMHHISLKHFCLYHFLAKQMGYKTLPFGHKSVYGHFEEKAFLLEQLLFYKHCIMRAVSSISPAMLLHSLHWTRQRHSMHMFNNCIEKF